jgi:hypothetical protein
VSDHGSDYKTSAGMTYREQGFITSRISLAGERDVSDRRCNYKARLMLYSRAVNSSGKERLEGDVSDNSCARMRARIRTAAN